MLSWLHFLYICAWPQEKRDEALKRALEWTPSAVSPKSGPKPERTQGTPFKRVEDDKWASKVGTFVEADNSYEARFGEGGYGAKANEKLRTVVGKDFRHEKTKRKRGTYRGGIIDTTPGSFKFKDADDDE